jgi:RimJ/RimL family protein N-acetyltransferase
MDPDAVTMAAFPSREQDAFMAHWTKIMADDANIIKAIIHDGEVAGSITSFQMMGEREVGYWIAKEFWGKGIATQALKKFLDIEKTRPLFGHVAKHNIASRRVLEKCGFTVIGEDKYMNPAGEQVEEFILKLES